MPPDENEQSPINSAEIAVPGNLNPGAGLDVAAPTPAIFSELVLAGGLASKTRKLVPKNLQILIRLGNASWSAFVGGSLGLMSGSLLAYLVAFTFNLKMDVFAWGAFAIPITGIGAISGMLRGTLDAIVLQFLLGTIWGICIGFGLTLVNHGLHPRLDPLSLMEARRDLEGLDPSLPVGPESLQRIQSPQLRTRIRQLQTDRSVDTLLLWFSTIVMGLRGILKASQEE